MKTKKKDNVTTKIVVPEAFIIEEAQKNLERKRPALHEYVSNYPETLHDFEEKEQSEATIIVIDL